MSEQNDKLLNKSNLYVEVAYGSKINKNKENHELEEIRKLVPKNEPITPMQEINKAYEVCKFGRFHVKLLFVSFFGCIASILVTNTTSYLLPIAECDLNMNLKQKGLLNAMPYFGMFVSTVIAGFLIDTFGRIYFLRVGFGGIFLCTLFSASSQTYEMLAFAKLCEGVLFATSLAALSSLTSEFCHTTVRDRVMLCQSSYAALAQILSPAMAWGILIQDWRASFFDGHFVLNVWNFYLLAMSLWSLIAFLLYLLLPESPKFLVTQKRYVEARNILIQIYIENSGKPADTFPYPNIFEKEIKEEDSQKADASDTKVKFRDKIMTGLRNMKPLLRRPLLGYIALIGFIQFITLGIHNVIRLWFPQLSTIVEHYNFDGNQNLCDLLDSYTGSLKIKSASNATSEVCVPHVSGTETYINSIIIGLVSLLPYFISGVVVNKVGKKVLLFIGGLMSAASLLGLRWSNSKTTMVALFSMNVAVTQTMKSLVQVVLIDVIPTAMRALSLSLVMLTARMGTLVSNVAFPILLAMGCSIPFYTMASMMSSKAREEWKTPMKEIDAALIACTFGRFHIKLLFIAFVGFLAGILASSTTAYLLPSAECDLEMDLLQKGLLNAMPYVGMLLSSVVAGFLTDAFGRKIFLGVGFLGLFIFQLIGGSSQTFEILAAAKFFEGLLYATAFSACVSLTAEFSYSSIRDRMLLCQSSFIAISHIIIAAMSWAILTNEWKYSFFGGKFVLNTWNFYLYIMSLWALGAFLMYVFCLPESPKYLLTQQKYDEAREILIKIYMENTGKPAETYPFYNIWKDKNKHSIDESPEQHVQTNIRHQIVEGLYNVKPMFQKPLVVHLAMTCFTNFVIMAMYNVLRLWFPQVSAIVEHNPLTEGQDLCSVLDTYTSSLKPVIHNSSYIQEICVPTKSGHETYINSIIIGVVCVIPYFFTAMLVNRVGKKPLLIAAGLISVASSLGLRWANSKTLVVALFSVTVSIAQSMLSLNQAMTVEMFPTTSRTLAISFIMVIGRIGTLSGNIAFPIMLQMGCAIPFFGISGCMVLVTAVALFQPSKKQ